MIPGDDRAVGVQTRTLVDDEREAVVFSQAISSFRVSWTRTGRPTAADKSAAS